MAKLENKKVLILERKSHLGGYTNEVRKQGSYIWEAGIQAVGQIEENSINRRIFNFTTDDALGWTRLPDVYSRLVYPDFIFDIEKGEENFRKDLIIMFPQEEEKISAYFRDVKMAAKWFNRNRAITTAPLNKKRTQNSADSVDKIALSTLAGYLDANFINPKLKALLASNWIACGLLPSEATFAIHAATLNHYFEGAYYPLGGSKEISETMILPVIKKGGMVLTNHSVEEIIVENGKAVGVKSNEIRIGEKIQRNYYSDIIISNIGARKTFNKLIPEFIDEQTKKEISEFTEDPVTITLYLALHIDPREMGFGAENIWIYKTYNHEENYRLNSQLTEGKCGAVMLSFPSLKLKNTQKHTAMIAVLGSLQDFHNWITRPHKNKEISKRALSGDISNTILDLVESRFSGFRKMIGFQDLSLPINLDTGEYIGGNIFGFPAIPQKFKVKWLHPETPLENFYITGSDISGHGVVGGMLSGVVTLNSILNVPISVFRVFRDSKQK